MLKILTTCAIGDAWVNQRFTEGAEFATTAPALLRMTSQNMPPGNRTNSALLTQETDRERRIAMGLCNIHEWRTTPPNAHSGESDEPIGVFAHIYYDTVASEMATLLQRVPRAKIYISTVSEKKKWLIETAFRQADLTADVRVFPNVGFDIGPLLFGFREELRSHNVCLHLHGKRSAHADVDGFGDAWRKHLFNEIAGSSMRAQLSRNAFLQDHRLGMLIPRHWTGISKWVGLGNNWTNFRSILDRLGVSVDPRIPIEYPAGSMFWFRSAALAPLLDLNLQPRDFEDSSKSAADGTLAHAIERCFLFSAARAGYLWAFLPEAAGADQYISCQESDAARLESYKELETTAPGALLFDAQWYLHQYPDVANSGMDAREHYITFGATEGRSPHPLFQASWYLRENPDAVTSGFAPLEHFFRIGEKRGARPHPLFDPQFYRDQVPNLSRSALLHYISIGAMRGLAPSRQFDPAEYIRDHPNAAADPLTHHTTHGGLPSLTGRRRIQVFRRGALGDVLLVTPVLRELRRKNPTAELVVSTSFAEVLAGNPNIDFLVNAEAPLYGCDATFNLDNAYEIRPDMHIVDAYALAVDVSVEQKIPDLYLNDVDRAAANELLQMHGLMANQPFVALQPTAGWQIKSWTPGRFQKVAKALRERGISTVVLGSRPGEPGFEADLRGKTNLRVAAAIIERSALTVTVDSGLMHMAFALRRPVIALFGCTLPELIVPPAKLSAALYGDVACRGCHHRQPPPASTPPSCIWETTRCMESISVDAVLQRTSEILLTV